MRCRSQSNDEMRCLNIPKIRDSFAPILLIDERGTACESNLLAPCDQSWAFSASYELIVEGKFDHGFVARILTKNRKKSKSTGTPGI